MKGSTRAAWLVVAGVCGAGAVAVVAGAMREWTAFGGAMFLAGVVGLGGGAFVGVLR